MSKEKLDLALDEEFNSIGLGLMCDFMSLEYAFSGAIREYTREMIKKKLKCNDKDFKKAEQIFKTKLNDCLLDAQQNLFLLITRYNSYLEQQK